MRIDTAPSGLPAIVGGNWNNGANCGVFCLNLNNLASNANANIGASLSYRFART